MGSFDHEPSKWHAACLALCRGAQGVLKGWLMTNQAQHCPVVAGGAEITRCFEPKRQPLKPGRWW